MLECRPSCAARDKLLRRCEQQDFGSRLYKGSMRYQNSFPSENFEMQARRFSSLATQLRQTFQLNTYIPITYQHGTYKADSSQEYRRQGPKKAAGHQGSSQIRTSNRRSQEASQVPISVTLFFELSCPYRVPSPEFRLKITSVGLLNGEGADVEATQLHISSLVICICIHTGYPEQHMLLLQIQTWNCGTS